MSQDATLIRDALAHHYVAHGLPLDGGASNPWFNMRIGPLTLRLPNPPARRRAVVMHDINHLVTGYNTTFSEGEMAIAAFEVGAGCGRLAPGSGVPPNRIRNITGFWLDALIR